MPPLVVATANIAQALPRSGAGTALRSVVAERPHLVALQEWYYPRRRLLPLVAPTYTWHAPVLGGCAIGVTSDRFEIVRRSTRWLSRPGWAARDERRWAVEPGRAATAVIAEERESGRRLGFVCFHLVSGVQSDGLYRTDRPRLVARHRAEARALQRLLRSLERRTDLALAAGDSNMDGFRIDDLTSSWDADTHGDADRGSLGRRRVDDVFAPTSPSSTRLVETGSDHRAVISTYLW